METYACTKTDFVQIQVHHGITPEIKRELQHGKCRDEELDEPPNMEMWTPEEYINPRPRSDQWISISDRRPERTQRERKFRKFSRKSYFCTSIHSVLQIFENILFSEKVNGKMGAYKYVSELYRKKQSDVMRYLLRIR